MRKAKISILPPGGNTWTEVELKDDVRAIVLLNLQVRVWQRGTNVPAGQQRPGRFIAVRFRDHCHLMAPIIGLAGTHGGLFQSACSWSQLRCPPRPGVEVRAAAVGAELLLQQSTHLLNSVH